MHDRLPQGCDVVRQRLLDEWVAPAATPADQVDGAAAIATALYGVLETVLGGVATRAIFNRASVIARRADPRLAAVTVVEGGLDLARLRANLGNADPSSSREALVLLIDELFILLNRLLGSALPPLLAETETELVAMRSARKLKGCGSSRADEPEGTDGKGLQ